MRKNSSEKVVTAKTAQEIEATVMEKLKALGLISQFFLYHYFK
jgi:hypothetical protein